MLKEFLKKNLEEFETAGTQVLEILMLAFNLIACASFVLGTYYSGAEPHWFRILEISIFCVFGLEYAARIYISEKPLRYIFSFYGLIDLLTIIPVFAFGGGFGFFRALRVLRILRFIRYMESEKFFFGSISKLKLQAARTIFTIFVLLFITSGMMLYSESRNPEAGIQSFDESFYYCVTTLATVGFGDIVPITRTGRWITISMMMSGMVLVPWQAGRLVRELLRLDHEHKRIILCQNCGLKEHDLDATHCKACGAVVFHEHDDIATLID